MPMQRPDAIVLAAMFARTNSGQSMPEASLIKNYRTAAKHGTGLSAMVNLVCGDFMESDDHYEMFLEEARGWLERFIVQELAYVWKHWPDKKLVWEASEAA